MVKDGSQTVPIIWAMVDGYYLISIFKILLFFGKHGRCYILYTGMYVEENDLKKVKNEEKSLNLYLLCWFGFLASIGVHWVGILGAMFMFMNRKSCRELKFVG